jgi:hypothetical protein
MTSAAATAWPWLVLAGLGVFHGLNPAMGWLFAAGLGMHRGSRRVVLVSVVPIALGHALSVAIVAAAVIALGVAVDARAIRIGAGALLIAWAVYHWSYGHRHRVRVGMTTGLIGLAVWSFLMATAHGAGLMLIPALMPLCGSGGPMPGGGSLWISLAAVGVHTLATLAVTGAIAIAVHDWLGLAFLRRGWINFDMLWTGMLTATGVLLILV